MVVDENFVRRFDQLHRKGRNLWAHEFGRAERRESGKMGWEIKYFAGRKTLGQRFLLLAIQYTVISGIANYQPKNLLYRVPIAFDNFVTLFALFGLNI